VDSPLSQIWEREHDLWVARRLIEMLKGEFEERTWRAFEGVALRGRPAAEVAAELGMTPNAIAIAKSRVLRRLHQEAVGLID
jgi:RNA polymerase sigma-70 factor (ECF subfamily)